MVSKKRSALFIMTCGLSLIGCETTNPQETVKVKSPMAFLKANKQVSPPVAQAFQLMKEEKYQEASKYINVVLQSQPKSVIFHILNGLAYEKLAERGDAGGLELAAVGYQNAINLDPANVFAITQLGKIKYREQKFGEAQESFANALLINPNDADLLQELAASSYYAHDIKTALVAIDKAVKIKPEDPLVNRSAAMIHASLGDFETAKKHMEFYKVKSGNDPSADQLASRYNDWVNLYKSGRISLAAVTTSTPAPPPAPSPSAQASNSSDDGGGDAPSNDGSTDLKQGMLQEDVTSNLSDSVVNVGQKGSKQYADSPQIVVDCYLLTILEDARTSKGNNIMKNLAVTLTPGGFTSYRGNLSGTGVSPTIPAAVTTASNGGTISSQPATGFNANQTSNGAPSVFTPATDTISMNNVGNVSGSVFTAGITWAGLTYSLNIANAVDLRTQVVSRPTLMTSLNQTTTFFSGDQLVYGIAGQYGGNLLKYNLGLTVVLTPVKIEGDMVSLNINIEGSLPTSADTNLAQTVDVALTQLNTHARMRLGETLMLGGMYVDADIYSKDGFPGLQDIPVVQYFFANEQTRSLRRSVMLMVTPRSPEMIKSAVNRDVARGNSRPNLDELASRNPDWFSTHPNLIPIIKTFNQDPVTYYEFRSGDILPPSWGWEPPLEEKLSVLSSFLYF